MGISQRASHPRCDFKRVVADGVADALCDDDIAGTRRNGGSRIVLPVVPVHGNAAPEFSPPQPMEQRTDIKSEGFPWPGRVDGGAG